MKFATRHRIVLLGVGLLLAVTLLLGGVHHHDGDEVCWVCMTALAALLPFVVFALAQLPVSRPLRPEVAHVPAWFLWVVHHYRGPPVSH